MSTPATPTAPTKLMAYYSVAEHDALTAENARLRETVKKALRTFPQHIEIAPPTCTCAICDMTRALAPVHDRVKIGRAVGS